MTRLNEFCLTAYMDQKTYKKAAKMLAEKFGKETYDEDSELYGIYNDAITIAPYGDFGNDDPDISISVDIEKLSDATDNPDLLEPSVDNTSKIIDMIRKETEILSSILPFDRFLITGLSYASLIKFPDADAADEYAKLLNKSVLTKGSYEYKQKTIPNHGGTCDVRTYFYHTQDGMIECYRIPKIAETDEATLVITTADNNHINIDRWLRRFSYQNKPIEEQLYSLMMGYMDCVTEILQYHFLDFPYLKKEAAIESIRRKSDDKKAKKLRTKNMINLINFITDEDTTCLDAICSGNKFFDKTIPSMIDLVSFGMQPVSISDSFDKTETFPDIFTLIEVGSYSYGSPE